MIPNALFNKKYIFATNVIAGKYFSSNTLLHCNFPVHKKAKKLFLRKHSFLSALCWIGHHLRPLITSLKSHNTSFDAWTLAAIPVLGSCISCVVCLRHKKVMRNNSLTSPGNTALRCMWHEFVDWGQIMWKYLLDIGWRRSGRESSRGSPERLKINGRMFQFYLLMMSFDTFVEPFSQWMNEKWHRRPTKSEVCLPFDNDDLKNHPSLLFDYVTGAASIVSSFATRRTVSRVHCDWGYRAHSW